MSETEKILADMRDIVMPQEPSLWPPAIGWWMLAGLAILTVFGAVYLIRNSLKSIARKTALSRLSKLSSLPAQVALVELSTLMRTVAISKYPRSKVAGLVGHDWLVFLDQCVDTNQFTNGPGQILAHGPYQKYSIDDCSDTIALCRTWIKQVL